MMTPSDPGNRSPKLERRREWWAGELERQRLAAEKEPKVPVMDADEARSLTDQIKNGIEVLWDFIKRAYTGRAWIALGYSSWDEYCDREFGQTRLRLPREERNEVVCSLRESGLSVRAISSATGLGVGTVHREIEAGVPNGTPENTEDSQESDENTANIEATSENSARTNGAVIWR